MTNLDSFMIESFLTIAETKNFTRAAEKMGRTQSAISQQIAKLESQLQKELFVRGRTICLTQEGKIFHSYAKQISRLHHELRDHFKEPDLQGEVRFGLPEDFASVFLTDLIKEYTVLHPRLKLNIECDLTLNLLEKFKRKEYDLVLLKMSKPDEFPDGTEVWSESLEWVGHSEFFSSNDDGLIPLVLAPQPCVYRTRAIRALEKSKKKWKIVFTSQSYSTTLSAVKAGMGITVLPRNMVPDPKIIIKHKSYIPELEDTHICLLKQNNEHYAVNSFEKFVNDKLNS